MIKNRIRVLSALFIIGLFLFSAQDIFSAKKVLPVKEKFQEETQWCWAGVSQAVLKYYKKNKKQGVIANFAWGRKDCNKKPVPANCNQPNYMYGTKGSIQGILNHWGVSCVSTAKHLAFIKVKKQINEHPPKVVGGPKVKGYPLIIRYGWWNGGGHFIIIRGYDTAGKKLHVVDPWFANGYGIFKYSYVKKKAGHHTWTHTLYDIKKK